MRHWLPRFAVNRPVTVLMGFLGLCVLGLIAFFRVPLQMMPSGFEPPYLWVWVPYQDSSPAETDAQIVRPLEEQLSTLPGIGPTLAQRIIDYRDTYGDFYFIEDIMNVPGIASAKFEEIKDLIITGYE